MITQSEGKIQLLLLQMMGSIF